ncbi:MazG-like protein [uncultured Veillonella sp.]|uniref:MazG-like protein n=1 Tax=uncultured Veillonella sp. TaxID=159268 RepID=UPI0025DA849A|nr:MazG-like protein [uncultured Veillonella sp.]MDY3973708.1 MazG-like protein [Veillonella caviae]
MKNKSITVEEMIQRNLAIRESYHKLENKLNGKPWTIEEDALGFLTDAALVGRLTMAHESTWPTADTGNDLKTLLPHKLGECVWWLATLAKRMDIDFEQAIMDFIEEKERDLPK